MKHLKTKLLVIALSCLGLTALYAQKENINVSLTWYPEPVIDGVEEEVWDEVEPVQFFLPFDSEAPTVTAYWKALWDCENIYVLISVEDDDHYPGWESGGNGWEYDKPEIYFDVNDTLVDGLGPATAGSGHYQFSPDFAQDGYDEMHEDTGTMQAPGGHYAYVLLGESYVYEYAVDISSMSNKYGMTLNGCLIEVLLNQVGFDATVIDQDEGITTARQRTVWQSGDGPEAEAWNNMDASGTITLIGNCCGSIKPVPDVTVSVNPNPVTDFITIDADFDKVVINDILSREISSINRIRSNQIDVGYLPKGAYFIRVYKGEKYIGAATIMKN
jgi:hypothetical protein